MSCLAGTGVLAASGRNNALFRVTCQARDHGWTRAEIQALLLDVHVVQPPSNPHQVETPEQRRPRGSSDNSKCISLFGPSQQLRYAAIAWPAECGS